MHISDIFRMGTVEQDLELERTKLADTRKSLAEEEERCRALREKQRLVRRIELSAVGISLTGHRYGKCRLVFNNRDAHVSI